MNSFPGWLKAVLVVAILALLTGGVSLNRVQERRVRQDVENRLKTITDLMANRIADWRADQLTANRFLNDGVRCDAISQCDRHIFQMVGTRCRAAIITGEAAVPPYPLHRLPLEIGMNREERTKP
jgi:hypothetical protein